jgi:predicted ATP-grasp superfamily ATP-dependent carboligase
MDTRSNATGSWHQKSQSTEIFHNERVGAVIIGGSFQALGVLRSLGRHGIQTYLLDQNLCISRFSRHTKAFFKCPGVKNDTHLLQFLKDLAQRERLEGWVVFPNDDETVCFLAKNKEELEKHYRITTPAWDVVKYAYDKKLTHELAEKCGIAGPKTFFPENIKEVEQLEVDFPVIIKPSVKEPFYSKTKKKAIRIDNKKQLIDEYAAAAELIADSQVLMVQELIPGGTGNLFSVGSLCKGGNLLARVVARRIRQHPMDFGHATTYAETVSIPELEESARKILGAMGYYGLSEVEFMLDPKDGKYKLLEINARPWGWHTLAIAAGVDLPYLVYLDITGQKVSPNGFATGVKWVRLMTDTPTALMEILKGRMKLAV